MPPGLGPDSFQKSYSGELSFCVGYSVASAGPTSARSCPRSSLCMRPRPRCRGPPRRSRSECRASASSGTGETGVLCEIDSSKVHVTSAVTWKPGQVSPHTWHAAPSPISWPSACLAPAPAAPGSRSAGLGWMMPWLDMTHAGTPATGRGYEEMRK